MGREGSEEGGGNGEGKKEGSGEHRIAPYAISIPNSFQNQKRYPRFAQFPH